MSQKAAAGHLFCQMLDNRIEKILSHRYNSWTDATVTQNSQQLNVKN